MRLAFIGTGKIIADALYAVSVLDCIERTAVFARPHSEDKARALAEEYDIKEVFTDYEALLSESTADTVYIGLVNSAHYEYARKALLNGKNVILEKPFTGFYKEALELEQLALEKKLFLLEAITILHNDVYPKLKGSLSKLGAIRMVQANYSQYSSRYDNYRNGIADHAFSGEYYGGALFDINIYNIHYCVSLFGKPSAVQYYPNLGFNGIDTSGVLILKYENFVAVCSGAKDSDSRCFVSIQGEDGDMLIDSKPNVASELCLHYVDPDCREKVRDAAGAEVRRMREEVFKAPAVHHRMTREFADFARIIDEKDYKLGESLLEESVAVIEILEKARLSAGIKF